jgi:hypothetical protein
MDTEVKAIARDALALMTKASEFFIEYIAKKCGETTVKRNAKTIRPSDIVNIIHTTETLEFLRLDFPRHRYEAKMVTKENNLKKKYRENLIKQDDSNTSIAKFFAPISVANEIELNKPPETTKKQRIHEVDL